MFRGGGQAESEHHIGKTTEVALSKRNTKRTTNLESLPVRDAYETNADQLDIGMPKTRKCNFPLQRERVSGGRVRVGFTLAEVLITLGIIGVVAAMTLPTLIQRYQDKSDYTHLKKIYSQLLQATMSIEQEYGSISEWELSSDSPSDSAMIMERYKKYFKSIKTCEEDMSACLPNVTYKTTTGADYASWYSMTARSSFLLPDGAIIMFNSQGFVDTAFQIYVDLNGWRKPNQLGNDFFYFYYFKSPKAIRPGGWYPTEEEKESNFKTGCMNAYGYYCANWLLENGNKDYLRCKDLSYSGKTKCK